MTPIDHQKHAINKAEAAKNRAAHDKAERLAENLGIELWKVLHIAQQMNAPFGYAEVNI